MIEETQTFLLDVFGWKIEIHEPTFEAKLGRVCKELGFLELDSCVKSLKDLQKDAKTLQAFSREFSVGETYFFRDLKFFDYFKSVVIPQIVQKNERKLSVWSVGCGSGEELYSIAMILRESIPNIDEWNLFLLGTDVNPEAIDKAKKGVFTQFSFRQTPQWYKSYFKALDGKFEISSKIKKMVRFKYHNAIDEPYGCLPPDSLKFDLILIKNVLIYFDKQKAKTVVNSLFGVIKEGGYLATTPAEYGGGIFDFPNSLRSPDGYLVQKLSRPNEEIAVLQEERQIFKTVIENVLESEPPSEPEPKQPKPAPTEDKYDYYHKALKSVKEGDVEKAKIFFRRALYLDKDFVMAHVVLANVLKKEKKFESAIKHVDNAKAKLLTLEPQDVVELSGGITASDLLAMLDAIKGDAFE